MRSFIPLIALLKKHIVLVDGGQASQLRYAGFQQDRAVCGNPLKDRFFTLLGRESSLQPIEHETLRKTGVYDEPRVHSAGYAPLLADRPEHRKTKWTTLR